MCIRSSCFYALLLPLALSGCRENSSQSVQSEFNSPTSEPTLRAASFRTIAESEAVPDLRTRRTGHNWPGFLGPTHDGKSAEKFALNPWLESGPPAVWHKRIGTSYGSPSLANGRLFMFDRHGDQARLTCMNSETGDELWRFEYATDYRDLYNFDNGPRTCPVVDNSRVYIFGAEGILHCLNVVDGGLLWKIDTREQFNVVQNFFGVGSTPVVEGEVLITQVGGSLPADATDVLSANGRLQGNGSGIVAFNKLSGEIAYKITDELASYASPTLATINGRRWCFVFARGGLFGFEPSTGSVDFHFPWRSDRLESVNASNPVVAGDRVFMSESYGPGSAVLEVRQGGYDLIWQDPRRKRDKSMLLHWTTAIHHDGYLYACHGMSSNGAALRCVDMATGKVVWSHRINERSSLIYVNEHFISLGEYGTLMLLRANPQKPDVVSKVKLVDDGGKRLIEYPAWAAPVLSNGYLYLRGKDRLVCLDLLFDE